MDWLLTAVGLAGVAALSLVAAGHALMYKRDSRSALGWMSISLTLPLMGPFLYWCLGINRISRRARIWHKSGRRISGALEINPGLSLQVPSGPLPPEASHLSDLSTLADRVTRTRLRPGNLLTPLVNGDETYPAMLAAIGSARTSINLSSYIFDADGVGADFIEQLKAAAERGVEVRVIIDALGEKYSRRSPRHLLAGSKVQLQRYLPLRHGAYINLRNHRKLLIVDGSLAFTGGMNIRDRHIPARASLATAIHDLHFRVQGPVVSDLQRAFLEDWHFVTGHKLENTPLFFPDPTLAGTALARCIIDGPDRKYRKLEQIILGALSCASRSVRIMTPYFVPDRSMVAALVTAALRGVEVTVLLPASNNIPLIHWANRAIIDELMAYGVRLHYQPPPFVHTKLFLVDDIWSLIGSANLDARSLRLNFELNLSVFDSRLAGQIGAHFQRCLAASRPITRTELKERSLPVQLRDNFARLFLPYL